MPVPSLDILGLVAVETLKISVPTLLESAVGKVSVEVCDARLDGWSRRLLEQARVQLTVEGRELIAPGESYVVMSNHQSHYDIPVLFQALQLPLRMVAKTELFRIPIMAHAMRVAGFVEVDRSNRARAIETLSSARDMLQGSLSVWIAPEGTRSPTGKLGPFKKGGFHLALGTGLRILPVTIEGTRRVLPARGLRVTRGLPVSVQISPPIDPSDYGTERREELIRAVRRAIEDRLPPELRSSATNGAGAA